MALEGRVQTCLRSIAMVTVTYQPGWRWPSELGMSISVWRVRVDGLSEKPERTTLPSRVAPGIAWKRMRAVSLVVDEVGGQLGDADEDADRVDLLEDEQRTAVVAAAGLEVVARADVALGDHAVVGGLDLAVLDVDLGLAFVGLGDDQIGAGGLDVDSGPVAVGDRLVARRFRLGDHRIGLVARRGGLLELAIGLVADLDVEDSLGDQRARAACTPNPSGCSWPGPA